MKGGMYNEAIAMYNQAGEFCRILRGTAGDFFKLSENNTYTESICYLAYQ